MAFTLDREGAARRLWVSSRTIDRHIQAGRIRTRRIGKRMFLEEDDVETIRSEDPARREEDYIVILDDAPAHVPEIIHNTKEPVQSLATKDHHAALTEFARLYDDAQKLIEKKDTVIQELSYKLGKVETELQNTIPLAEYKKATYLLESAKAKSDTDASSLTEKITKLETEVNKRNSALVALAILFVLVLAFSVVFFFYSRLM